MAPVVRNWSQLDPRPTVSGTAVEPPVSRTLSTTRFSRHALPHAGRLRHRRDLGMAPAALAVGALVAALWVDSAFAAESTVSALVVEESADHDVILTVEATQAPTFQVFRVPGQAHYVVELPGVRLGSALQTRGPGVLLLDATVEEANKSSPPRLLLSFADDVDYDAQARGATLEVRFTHHGDKRALVAAAEQRKEKAKKEREAALSALRQAEERKLASAEAERRAESERLAAAEKKRQEEEAKRIAALEAKRKADEERLATAEKKRQAEEAKRIAALEAKKRADEERAAAAEKRRLEEEAKRTAALEAKKKADEERAAAVAAAAEKKRLDEEAKRIAALEAKKKADEVRAAAAAAAEKKRLEEDAKRQAALEKKRLEEDAKRQAALEAERRAAEARAAEARAAEAKAAEQKAAEQKAAEQKAAEQKAAEQRAAEQRAAEQRARAEAKRLAELERARAEAEAKATREAEARRLVELEAKRQAEERRIAEQNARQRADEEAARKRAEEDARRRAAELARQQAELARQQAEQRRLQEEREGEQAARRRAEAEAQARAQEDRRRQEAARVARAEVTSPRGPGPGASADPGFGGGSAGTRSIDLGRPARYERVQMPSDEEFGGGEEEFDELDGRSVLSRVTVQRTEAGSRVGVRVDGGAKYDVKRRGKGQLVLTLFDTRAETLEVRRVLDARALDTSVMRVLPSVEEDQRFRVELLIELREQAPVKIGQSEGMLWLDVGNG